jgi:hypothetical protein
MKKFKDRITLGIVSGFVGIVFKIASDEFFLRQRISKRSFRETASGVWVNTRKQAKSPQGQLLGSLLDLGMGMLGSVVQVFVLSKTGKDSQFLKGSLFGIVWGSFITAALSALPINKVKPKDAVSNLSYMFSHALFGITTTYAATLLGDNSLWDAPPLNNDIQPAKQTLAQEISIR